MYADKLRWYRCERRQLIAALRLSFYPPSFEIYKNSKIASESASRSPHYVTIHNRVQKTSHANQRNNFFLHFGKCTFPHFLLPRPSCRSPHASPIVAFRFSLIVRPRGYKQKKWINMSILFVFLYASLPNWILIYRQQSIPDFCPVPQK